MFEVKFRARRTIGAYHTVSATDGSVAGAVATALAYSGWEVVIFEGDKPVVKYGRAGMIGDYYVVIKCAACDQLTYHCACQPACLALFR